jgi:hypothetical protein
MPEVGLEERLYIRLYNETKRWGVLPDSGSIMEQDADTMECLDVINELVEAEQRRKAEELEREKCQRTRT